MGRKKKQRKYGRKRDYLIRAAVKKDSGFIRKLSGKVFSIFGDYEEIIPRLFLNPDVITLIYSNKSRPIGFAMLYVLSGEILAIAVIPGYQRRGIGLALLKYLEGIASQLGIKKLLLHTAKENEAAQFFFQKASFKVIGDKEQYYPKGQTALIMCKEI